MINLLIRDSFPVEHDGKDKTDGGVDCASSDGEGVSNVVNEDGWNPTDKYYRKSDDGVYFEGHAILLPEQFFNRVFSGQHTERGCRQHCE